MSKPEIVIQKQKCKKFGEIEMGQCFTINDKLYIRSKEIAMSGELISNVTCLNDGSLDAFRNDFVVTPVKVKMEVTYE